MEKDLIAVFPAAGVSAKENRPRSLDRYEETWLSLLVLKGANLQFICLSDFQFRSKIDY